MSAAYLVQGDRVFAKPGDPKYGSLKPYDVLICNASLPVDAVAAAAKPGALIFGSFNMTMLAKAGPNNPFYNSLRAAMDQFILRDEQGNPVLESEYGEPFFDFTNIAGAVAYAGWITANHTGNIYMDDCTAVLPNHKVMDLPDKTVAEKYPRWRDLFLVIMQLRAPGKAVIANSAGWRDNTLHGIGIEESHQAKLGTVKTLGIYALQAWNGRKPTVNLDFTRRFEFPSWIGLHKVTVLT